MELNQYRYLPLHLAILYLKISSERNYFCISTHCLTNAVPRDSSLPLGLNLIHKSKEFPNSWADAQTLLDLKLKNPWTTPLNIFKSPFYPGRNYVVEEVENEKDIIFSRNKSLISKVKYLLDFEVENNLEDRIPFYLVIPYLFLNKNETIITSSPASGRKIELQYDPQNISLRYKDLSFGAKYGKNSKTQKEFIAWYDLFIGMNGYGHLDERLHPSQKFDRFYLPGTKIIV
jgi:hypothetical protein